MIFDNLPAGAYQLSGFIVAENECLANTRKGKTVLNLKSDEARALTVVNGELVASVGENRKMLIFPIADVPEMTRGRGVRLQRYKEKGLSDVTTFKAEDGLSWNDAAGRSFALPMKELKDWRGNRADAGRLRGDHGGWLAHTAKNDCWRSGQQQGQEQATGHAAS